MIKVRVDTEEYAFEQAICYGMDEKSHLHIYLGEPTAGNVIATFARWDNVRKAS